MGDPEAATACSVSSSTRSALIWAPAEAPAAAAAPTCAVRSVTFPGTHTPGTAVRPVGSQARCSPTPPGCSCGFSPRSARKSAGNHPSGDRQRLSLDQPTVAQQ